MFDSLERIAFAQRINFLSSEQVTEVREGLLDLRIIL